VATHQGRTPRPRSRSSSTIRNASGAAKYKTRSAICSRSALTTTARVVLWAAAMVSARATSSTTTGRPIFQSSSAPLGVQGA